MDDKPSTILAIFPHPDDELGCIGTLANHSQRGDKVHMIWTTY
ncbi:MAG: PIG-L family deacetylase, partial [Candidatus Heimdallarchaeota archaeon]|nr:PIG-L family deacetylase [Candidatus Heimdallarchaeota archaeon]MCK5049635.1 PIG-L family deacetylase [Candidatus Heimdallarchaeota archaeon]